MRGIPTVALLLPSLGKLLTGLSPPELFEGDWWDTIVPCGAEQRRQSQVHRLTLASSAALLVQYCILKFSVLMTAHVTSRNSFWFLFKSSLKG